MYLSLITLSLTMLVYANYHSILVPELQDDTALISCVNTLIDTFKDNTFIYTVNFDHQLKKPVIRIDPNKTNFYRFRIERSQVIVIDPKNHHLEEVLTKLRKNQSIDFRSYFIIVTNNITTPFFTTTARFFINRLLVVVGSEIYGYQPFLDESANNPAISISHLSSCSSLTRDIGAMPSRWRNTTITALTNIVPPYCICPSCSTNKGIEIEAFDVIAEHLQFKVDYTRNSFDYWGSKINDSYTHILGELENQAGDMTIGVFHSKFDEHLDFDVSFAYMEDSTRWLVPKARILPYWKRIGLIFSAEIYLAILLSTASVMLVCRYLYSRNFASSWLLLYQILLECSIDKMPDFRTVAIFWTGSCLILSTVFKSKLIDTMSKNSYEHQIDSLKDIVASKLHVVIDHDIARFYDYQTNSDEEYIRSRYEFCPDPRVCINRTAFEQDCVTIDFERSNLFFLPQLVDENGDVLTHLFKEPVFPVHIQLFFVKGYPLFPQIDRLLLLLRSNGVVQHLYDKAGHNAKLAMSRRSTFAIAVLGVEQLQIAFLMWGVGIALAFLVFVFEQLGSLPKLRVWN